MGLITSKVCTTCGTPVGIEHKFCYNCGACVYGSKKLAAVAEMNTIAPQEETEIEYRHVRINVVNVGNAIKATELAANEEFEDVKFFSADTVADADMQKAFEADVLFIAVDATCHAALHTARKLTIMAKKSNILVFFTALSGFHQDYIANHSVVLRQMESDADVLFTIPISSKAFSTESISMVFTDVMRALLHCLVGKFSDPMLRMDLDEFKTFFCGFGKVFLGIGESDGEEAAMSAAREAGSMPISIPAAAYHPEKFSVLNHKKFHSRVFIYIEGNNSMSILDMRKAIEVITDTAADDASVYWYHAVNPAMMDVVRVIVIAA